MFLCIALPAQGQSDYGWQGDSDAIGSYLCFQCPVCGGLVKMTPQEAALTSPYASCPYCFSAYAYQFIQVQCPALTEVPANKESESKANTTNEPQTVESASNRSIESSTTGNASGSIGKILMVIPQKNYQEMEFNQPKAYFESNGYIVKTASKGTTVASGSSGESASIDMDIKNINISDFKAVVFVGGEGIDELKLYEDQDYLNLAKSAVQSDMVVGAICLAPKILANAGLLSGKSATSSDPDYIKSKGAELSDQQVVQSGKIITGNGPYASEEFAQTIVAALVESVQPRQEEKANTQGSEATSKWKCTVCGYVYDPAENGGVPFEQLPSTWKCPVCGVGKDKFARV